MKKVIHVVVFFLIINLQALRNPFCFAPAVQDTKQGTKPAIKKELGVQRSQAPTVLKKTWNVVAEKHDELVLKNKEGHIRTVTWQQPVEDNVGLKTLQLEEAEGLGG